MRNEITDWENRVVFLFYWSEYTSIEFKVAVKRHLKNPWRMKQSSANGAQQTLVLLFFHFEWMQRFSVIVLFIYYLRSYPSRIFFSYSFFFNTTNFCTFSSLEWVQKYWVQGSLSRAQWSLNINHPFFNHFKISLDKTDTTGSRKMV